MAVRKVALHWTGNSFVLRTVSLSLFESDPMPPLILRVQFDFDLI